MELSAGVRFYPQGILKPLIVVTLKKDITAIFIIQNLLFLTVDMCVFSFRSATELSILSVWFWTFHYEFSPCSTTSPSRASSNGINIKTVSAIKEDCARSIRTAIRYSEGNTAEVIKTSHERQKWSYHWRWYLQTILICPPGSIQIQLRIILEFWFNSSAVLYHREALNVLFCSMVLCLR